MISPVTAFATPALGGLFAASAFNAPRAQSSTILQMGPPSKVKNENPDDFATYLAKRQAAEQGVQWQPPAGAAPAAPQYAAPPPQQYAAPAAAAPAAAGPPSKIKNANPDDFATYLAKRQAADQGVAWQPPAAAAPPQYAAPPPQQYAAPPAAAAPAAAGPPSKIKNANPDDFATYLAKRRAVEAGRPESDFPSFM